jgi:hypothetical protein
VRITTGRSMGRKSGRRSRAPIQEGVELLEYELYQKLLEEFMTSRPHRTVMARHDREL